MDEVVTEELRVAGKLGREMIETEEAVELAACAERQLEIKELSEKAAGKQPVRPPVPVVPAPIQTEHNALTEALSDPNISPGPAMTARILSLARDAKRTVTTGEPSERIKLTGQQPSAKDFLARDYHSVRANRFLFSCADEYDGCAQNRGGAWLYSLPESSAGSSSHNIN